MVKSARLLSGCGLTRQRFVSQIQDLLQKQKKNIQCTLEFRLFAVIRLNCFIIEGTRKLEGDSTETTYVITCCIHYTRSARPWDTASCLFTFTSLSPSAILVPPALVCCQIRNSTKLYENQSEIIGTMINICIYKLNSRWNDSPQSVAVPNGATVRDLKQVISMNKDFNYSPERRRLKFKGDVLEDDNKTLSEHGIRDQSSVRIKYLKPPPPIKLSNQKYDETRHYDLSQVAPSPSAYSRGGQIYIPPYGWTFYGFANLNAYGGDDNWMRYETLQELDDAKYQPVGEWAIAYRGIGKTVEGSMDDVGNSVLHAEKNDIYTTPDIKVASQFAEETTENGIKYRIVLQFRVRTFSSGIRAVRNMTEIYWKCYAEDNECTRLCGFCVQKVK